MKKITLVMTFLLLWSINSNAQYLTEGFEGATFPPAGWTDVVGPGTDTGDLWAASTLRANTGTQSARYEDFASGASHDRWLISPALDLSVATAPELLYFDNVDFFDFADTHDVYYSTDYDGLGDPTTASWTLINGVIGTEDTWVQNGPYALPAVAGVYIAFNYVGTFASEWYIDDILVRENLGCDIPVATFAAVENCPVDDGFTIEVNITDIGAASGVTITDDQGTAASTGLAAGTYTYGSYANATDVVITVTNDDSGVCFITSSTLTYDGICPPPPPANDDFVNAQAIDCTTTALTGSTEFATLDEDDAPDGFGADMDAPNVWFSYDSATEGAADVTVSLCGSTYDTSILVYTGVSGALTLVAGNDDNEAACGAFSVQSEGTFTANGTDTYYIAVEGFNFASTGDFTLSVTCEASCTPAQANQDCASATALLVNGITTTQDNTCAVVNATQPSCDLFQSIADLWFTFDAPASGEVDIVTSLGTATASHLAVYEGTCGALTELSCSTVVAAGASLTGLTGGTTYYVQLWNNGSEEGTIDITLSDASLSLSSFDNENAFTYFPNPVKNELSLKAQNAIQNVSVFNMLGQEVLRATPNTLESNLDMNGLSQGAYFVQVTINNVTETVRILKQ
ncbi:T9SS-dependent choice-of-anchor J family protein [Psychroserpens mesophilus]|uniref:T9SS-dependent choice-of-anchor J family protein n=1 Tax=Psychroserpens mesophilus TaxID=325473 RepID=UPI00058F7985|nr:choice-of-anchor J domain-containing protein [Psychroserpens mesophilus]